LVKIHAWEFRIEIRLEDEIFKSTTNFLQFMREKEFSSFLTTNSKQLAPHLAQKPQEMRNF